MNSTTGLKAVLALFALVLTVGLAACGEDEDTATVSGGAEAAANGTDRAFAAEMVPHHRSAVEMAEIARERAERPETKQLAEDIVTLQNEEIEQLEAIDRRLEEAGVEPRGMGMSDLDMGMDMDASALEDAEPFERAFIDMMIPHHQGAIMMARMELAEGEDPRRGAWPRRSSTPRRARSSR
jgi:uncharacterized protein (DUF305 family)